ncbi:MAG TPA: chromate efflux transporter [Solirubrobacteraceae bacterium]|nr:chromate efflux transporter [Solirubrobacteraceae bacterium]
MPATRTQLAPSLRQMVREWGRIGCVGFGGPPAHIALLRELCVDRHRWLSAAQFERALAAANVLPGPASTQLAIYCAWRVRGDRGALVGGLSFILPGLILIIPLSVLFLASSPPTLLRAAGAGAGAAVAAVAVAAGLGVGIPSWKRAQAGERPLLLAYALAGGAAAATLGPWLVLVLLGCGAAELARSAVERGRTGAGAWLAPGWLSAGRAAERVGRWLHRLPPLAAAEPAGVAALAWTALKVGALSFGGGFVIVPLMQADAVSTYHWMTHEQFLNAVVLGQVTPGPVTHTVASVGYSAAGIPGALLASAVAFAPSFAFVLFGAARFERLLADRRALAFLAGAAPAAAGAIIGAAIPLASSLVEGWQLVVLAAAAVALLVLRRGVVPTLLLAGGAGIAVALLGGPVPA